MEITQLVFIPSPGVGHLAPMIKLAKAITTRDEHISATVFIMDLPNNPKVYSYAQSLISNDPPPRVKFVPLSLDEPTVDHLRSVPRGQWMQELVQIHKPQVNEFLSSESTHRLGGFVVDSFCIPFIDVATEFGVPSYLFFTSGVGTLNFLFYFQSLIDDKKCDVTKFKDSNANFRIPGFLKSVPVKVLPQAMFEKENSGSSNFLKIPRRLRETKGILVNTFVELQPYAVECLSSDDKIPPIYAVGPVLNLNSETSNDTNEVDQYNDIMKWLDSQPETSVVFLCFGSMGTFEAEQAVQIANALEQSGHRFLWSLRKPPPKGNTGPPTEYENLNDILPEGFLNRTKDIGKVIGWAPQVAVLSHPAVGGFVSHCGWNSTLESLWFGVPMATWPLYAEQHLNAFELVDELGLAVEIKMDYRKENSVILKAEEIEKGIKRLMEGNLSIEIRKKVKAMREKSHLAAVDGGSSDVSIRHFIQEVVGREYP